MDARKLQRTADELLGKHGSKLTRGVDSAERFAKKRAKGQESQVERVASTLRRAIGRRRPHR